MGSNTRGSTRRTKSTGKASTHTPTGTSSRDSGTRVFGTEREPTNTKMTVVCKFINTPSSV